MPEYLSPLLGNYFWLCDDVKDVQLSRLGCEVRIRFRGVGWVRIETIAGKVRLAMK